MHPEYAQQQPFPPTIDAVPAEERLAETFMFTPGALAVGALLGLVGSGVAFASPGGPTLAERFYWPAGCIAGALLFGAWEIMRRLRRTSLVFHGDQIGIYRAGRLAEVASRGQLQIHSIHLLATIRLGMLFTCLGAWALIKGAAFFDQDPGLGLLVLGAAVPCWVAFVSLLYVHIACREVFVPMGSGTELLTFTRAACKRFGM